MKSLQFLSFIFFWLTFEYCSSQNFIDDISSFNSIGLDEFLIKNPNQPLFINKYSLSDFESLSQKIKNSYYDKVGAKLNRGDSVSVSNDFKELSHSLLKRHNKEIKKIINKLNGLNSKNDKGIARYIIEPCYLLRVDENRPIAYVISQEYLLIDKLENKKYKLER